MVTLTEIAARINAHLVRFERSKTINAPFRSGESTLSHYYYAGAARAGSYVSVCYVSYQGHTCLNRSEAERYLAKLDGGFVGRHFEALREA